MSEKYYGVYPSFGKLVSVGDVFALRDIDGGPPTGEYEITHIRVDTHYRVSYLTGQELPFHRVYFGVDMGGRVAYTRDVNCIMRSVAHE